MTDVTLLYEAIACERELERNRVSLVLAAREAMRTTAARVPAVESAAEAPLPQFRGRTRSV